MSPWPLGKQLALQHPEPGPRWEGTPATPLMAGQGGEGHGSLAWARQDSSPHTGSLKGTQLIKVQKGDRSWPTWGAGVPGGGVGG